MDTDPEELIRLVGQRKREWQYVDEVVRMVKAWAEHRGLMMKPLTIEAMVLQYLPRPRFSGTLTSSEAVTRFFEAAHAAHIANISDPAGQSGEVDPAMN